MLKYLCLTITSKGPKAIVLTASNVEVLLNQPDQKEPMVVFEINTEHAVHTLVEDNCWVPVPEPSPDGK